MPRPGLPRHTGTIGGLGFRRIPTVLTSQEILDKAFLRASKVTVPGKDALERTRGTVLGAVRSAQNNVDATLGKYITSFPSFAELPPFYRELAEVLVDVDRTRKALGAVDWARKQVNVVADEAVLRMKRVRDTDQIHDRKRAAYGRISSVVNQIEDDLAHLNVVRNVLRKLPYVDVTQPTIVVAGYPNVGKSSLLRRVSNAEPEVASYPFTTKGIVVGHHTRDRRTFQVIDTPGVLDRPVEDRNAIERQAILALRHLADVVVFLLDPSGHCGYPMESQERLLAEVKAVFPDTPVLEVENKADLGEATGTKGRFLTSTETGDGIDALMDAAAEATREAKVEA